MGEPPTLLVIVRPLISFIQKLPRYTMLTQDLSDAAIALRKAITDAGEPDTLLFEQLPQALGFDAFGPLTERIQKQLMRFSIPCEAHCPN